MSSKNSSSKKKIRPDGSSPTPFEPGDKGSKNTRIFLAQKLARKAGQSSTVPQQSSSAAKSAPMGGAAAFQGITSVALEQKNLKIQITITIIAHLGLLLSLWETENCYFCYASDPTILPSCADAGPLKCCYDPDLGNDDCSNLRPYTCCGGSNTFGFVLKGLSTVCSIVCLILLWRYYRGASVLRALRNHVEFNRPLSDSSLGQTGMLLPYIAESVMVVIHPPPGFSMMVYIAFKGKIAAYRIEELLVLVMFCRMYFTWKSYRDYVFVQHTSKKFASLIHTTPIDSKFVVKAALDAHPIRLIGIVFCITVITSAYWIRVAEGPMIADLTRYFWNCCWFIVVTMTTTGYGDFTPITHIGRGVAVVAMILGNMLSAILTAAIYSNLSFNSQEFTALNFMYQARWQVRRKDMAARLIQNVWLHGPSSSRTAHALKEHHDLRMEYFAWTQGEPHFGKVMKDVINSTQAIDSSMDMVMSRVMRLQADSDALKQHEGEIMPPPGSESKMTDANESLQKKNLRSEKDLQMLLGEMDSQKKLIENLLRAVIFLSSSRSKDTETLRSELDGVRVAIQGAGSAVTTAK